MYHFRKRQKPAGVITLEMGPSQDTVQDAAVPKKAMPLSLTGGIGRDVLQYMVWLGRQYACANSLQTARKRYLATRYDKDLTAHSEAVFKRRKLH